MYGIGYSEENRESFSNCIFYKIYSKIQKKNTNAKCITKSGTHMLNLNTTCYKYVKFNIK